MHTEQSSSAHAPSAEATSRAFPLPICFCARRLEQVELGCTGKELCRGALRAAHLKAVAMNPPAVLPAFGETRSQPVAEGDRPRKLSPLCAGHLTRACAAHAYV